MLRRTLSIIICLGFATACLVTAQDSETKFPAKVSLKISGPGAIDDTTIKVGEKFSVDLYFSNDTIRRGISVGFRIFSDDIKKIVHAPDSGNGISEQGDIKAYNGWQNKSVFDFTGIIITNNDWDGDLPDTAGFVGIVIKKRYQPHAETKCLSWDIIVPTTGTITIDSCFFPPGGDWMYDNNQLPEWGGPYTFKVVE